MIELQILLTFFFTQLLAVMLPGPDTLIVIRSSLCFGRRHGILSALGVASAVAFYSGLVIFGISHLRDHYQIVFRIIAICGAGYLFYLAYRCIKPHKKFQFDENSLTNHSDAHTNLSTSYIRGLLTNLSNPKALVYFLSILPLFVGKQSNIGFHCLLWFIIILSTITWFSIVSFFMGHAKVRRLFTHSIHILEYVFASVLTLFAILILILNI